mmetsp:Transcript_57068/g.157996  ORF Transcript_57068/g.157996 Transcript_57068/m.157996 type:complete len:306 (-) Transcript_57068:860-1777(-)
MSENMIVTSRRETESCVELGSPRTMLRTTVSGTKRAKASMPRERLQKVPCSLLTSLMRERRPERSSANSRDSCAKSRSPKRRMSLLSFCNGCETRYPRPNPKATLSTVIPKKMASPAVRASPTRTSEPERISVTSVSTNCATTAACIPKAPTGKVATTSQRVCSSRVTERVPTCRQSRSCLVRVDSGSHSSSTGGCRWTWLGRKVKRCWSVWSSVAFHERNFVKIARAVELTTSCGESTACVKLPGMASVWLEEPTKKPCWCGKRWDTWLTMNMLEFCSPMMNLCVCSSRRFCSLVHCFQQSKLT